MKQFEKIINFLDVKSFKNLDISYEKSSTKNLFYIKKDKKKVLIKYGELCSAFMALSYLKAHRNETSFEINTKRRFDSVAFMYDVSRNAVPTVDTVKELIQYLACFGFNELMLYTEDTYEIDGYPFFGYFRGGFSKVEIKEIVKYAKEFGVEVVPCIQTLGHLERPLRWLPFHGFRDGLGNLNPAKKETYDFIEAMIKSCAECYESRKIHLGLDEVFELGLGKYLLENGYTERNKLFIDHLNKVLKIAKKYGFKPMMWSDMFFRLNNEQCEYYNDKPLPKEVLNILPKSVGLVYWDYYHQEANKNIYHAMMKHHLETGNPVLFAGGAWKWQGFAPSNEGSFKTNIPGLKAASENGIKDIILTAWGDNGAECPLFSVLPVFALYSQVNYFNNTDEKEMAELFKAVTDENFKHMFDLDLLNKPDGKFVTPAYNPSKYFFYQDPLCGFFDTKSKNNYVKNYQKYADQLYLDASESKRFSYLYLLEASLAQFLAHKVDLGYRIRKAYKAKDKKVLTDIAKKEIDIMLENLDAFEKYQEAAWFKENKPFGFEVINGRIGWLKNRLINTKKVLLEYLKGKTKSIPQLEQKVLPYEGIEGEVCWNQWRTTVSSSEV